MTQNNELKSREIDILRLMNEELTNREIAEHLHISKETVRWYAKQIYSKLEVSSRKAATEKALKIGLIGQDQTRIIGTHEGRSKYVLPMQLTSFIGREKQIEEICQLLNTTRLLSLIGPGGTGKTRLSIRVAETLASTIPYGIFFIDLAPVASAEKVAKTLANRLNIFESREQPITESIKKAIGQRKILLLLDNYEHVIEAASLVVELLMASPNLKIIVTSREPLRVSGEQIYSVPPMTLSGNSEDKLSEAVLLFLQRSQAMKLDFEITDQNLTTVVDICRRLDGMPLAIELAASLSRVLTPDAILVRMNERFKTLTSGSRDLPARQQTLRNAIDWSYNLLKDEEKIVFARLSVFRGGCSLGAIEAVCRHDLTINVFDTLSSLVDKSMIRQIEDDTGEPRFVMLEIMQEYASQCLMKTGETETLQRNHAQHYVDLTTHASPYLRQAGYDYWFSRLNVEQENIRMALQWSLTNIEIEMGLRLVQALRDYWFYEGYHLEGQQWTQQALEHLDKVDRDLQIGVLMTAGTLAHGQEDIRPATSYYEQALAIARQQKNSEKIAWALIFLAASQYGGSGQTIYDKAIAMCDEGRSIFEQLNHNIGLAQTYNFIGNIHRIRGKPKLAELAYEKCLELSLETGEQRRQMITYANLSMIHLALDNDEASREYAINALKLAQQIDFPYMSVLLLGNIIPATIRLLGRYEQAAKILGASTALQQTMNVTQLVEDRYLAESTTAQVKQELGNEKFQSHFDSGSRMTLEDTVDFALRELEK